VCLPRGAQSARQQDTPAIVRTTQLSAPLQKEAARGYHLARGPGPLVALRSND